MKATILKRHHIVYVNHVLDSVPHPWLIWTIEINEFSNLGKKRNFLKIWTKIFQLLAKNDASFKLGQNWTFSILAKSWLKLKIFAKFNQNWIFIKIWSKNENFSKYDQNWKFCKIDEFSNFGKIEEEMWFYVKIDDF